MIKQFIKCSVKWEYCTSSLLTLPYPHNKCHDRLLTSATLCRLIYQAVYTFLRNISKITFNDFELFVLVYWLLNLFLPKLYFHFLPISVTFFFFQIPRSNGKWTVDYQIGWKWFKLGFGLGEGEGSGFWTNIIRIRSDFILFVPR